MLILVKDHWGFALLLGKFNGHDLFLEVAFLRRPFHIVVAAQGDGIDLFPTEVMFIGNEFRRDPHDIGFTPEEVDNRTLLDRPLLKPGQQMGSGMQTMHEIIHKNLILEAASPAGRRD